MTLWLVEPRDPLIARDGRPFDPDPGAWATSLPFPFPSTLAGGVRTRSGLDENGAFQYVHDEEQLAQLKTISIRGPLLVQLEDERDEMEQDGWFVPFPQDIQFFESQAAGSANMALLHRLVPLHMPEDAHSDLEDDDQGKHLLLVGQMDRTVRKPLSHALRYLPWSLFRDWLINPATLEDLAIERSQIEALGRKDLVRDRRLHVSMDSDREAGKAGLLFGTSGLEFTYPGFTRPGEKPSLRNTKRLALAVEVNRDMVVAGVAGFAGERRFVTWRKSAMQLPSCPDDVVKEIKSKRKCRLILLTPACFANGYVPAKWLREHAEKFGLQVEIQAIAVRRPQVVSGWDFEHRKPKPTRRLAPAGTVLFLALRGGDDAALSKWIEETWMQCVSDDEQDRRDGFGLAALGTWSGSPIVME